MTPGTAQTRRFVLRAAGALLLPRTARAQPSRRRRIATLSVATHASEEALWEAFRQQLHALGYADEDIAIESRYADGYGERLPKLAAELVQLSPEVIVTRGSAAAKAAKEVTATIPIVMAMVADPVGDGLVASLAHPGGNVTGVSTMQGDFAAKEMQLLLTAVPGAKRIAVLVNPDNPTHAGELNSEREAARSLGVTLIEVGVRSPDEIDGAFAAMTRERVDALVMLGDAFFFTVLGRIAGLATSRKLPVIDDHSGFPAVGGLMSYGPDIAKNFRDAASYVDNIFKGIKPAELPLEQPTTFQLVINLKTAKAIGLTVPQSLLARADEVIE